MARCIFTGANLIDGDRPARAGVTVVVEGERIASVNEGPLQDVRPDDRTIDLAGKTLMPGLVLCHFHATFYDYNTRQAPSLGLEHTPTILALLAAKHVELALASGVTSVVSGSCPHRIDASIRDAITLGLIPGPRMWAASHELCSSGDIIDAQNLHWQYELGNAGTTRKVDGPEGFRTAVREEIAWGSDIVKLNVSDGHGVAPASERMSCSPEELRAAADAAHERGKKVRAHVASRRGVLECARAGFDVIDHADRMDAECIDAILEAGSFVVPSMLFPERFLAAMESVDLESGEQVMSGMPSIESTRDVVERIRGVREDFEYTRGIVPEAHAAGVKLVLGDDYGTAVLQQGEYAAELEFYVKDVGIPPLDVIRWGTRNGAELMDMGDQLGTIEPGKLADLLVVDGDPIVDIACLQQSDNLLAIVKGGYFVKDRLGP
ncbi:MAG: amidohydrolase family protein [Myxococcota bacterium]|nr:amidohydrolase family protein [Myxococcota bacterium]